MGNREPLPPSLARAEYLKSKAIGVASSALAAHCYSDMLWKLDLAQLHLVLALPQCNAVGAWVEHSAVIRLVRNIVLVFAALCAIGAFFVDRLWDEGRLVEGESLAQLRAERRVAAHSTEPVSSRTALKPSSCHKALHSPA